MIILLVKGASRAAYGTAGARLWPVAKPLTPPQASTVLACDFFTVDCAVTLRRLYVPVRRRKVLGGVINEYHRAA